jgi:16S rRNA (guanine527-N7)-methyltransferase
VNFKNDVETLLRRTITEEQLRLFEIYYQFLIEYNEITNLTRITEKQEVYYKHFFDSLTLTNVIDFEHVSSVCDMGSGAGFPSLPLKIMYPHLDITIIDSLGKRIMFLNLLVQKLQLNHVNLVHDRVETYATSHQQKFDIVTARALGHLSLISEMGIPMAKINGYFLAPKGLNVEEEIKESKHAISLLGGAIKSIKSFELPLNYGHRTNILLQKKKHIDGYPRTYVQMIKKPL